MCSAPINKNKFRFRILSGLTALTALACVATSCASQIPYAPQQMTAFRPAPTALGAMSASRNPAAAPLQLFRAVNPQQYYQAAQGKSGKDLLLTLHNIVAKHKDLGYDLGRDIMFGDVDDLDNDNVVEGVYSGRRLPNVTNRTNAYMNGKGLNAEHTWPKSKGAGGGPAKADLHHLFPTDIKTNSTRSSYPFGYVAKVLFENGGSKFGFDSQGRKVFEPRNEHKGNLARALLYFYTVYGAGGGNISLQNFSQEEPILKRWHQMDPVDRAERARNDAVFKFQGNRNPYIDHPEYVEQVGRFMP